MKFKIILFTIIVAMSLMMIGGCTDSGNNPGGNNVTIKKGNANNPEYYFVSDGDLPEAISDKQITINKLQATDDFGRSFSYIDGQKTDKSRYVGLFYFTWLGWHGGEMKEVYDVSKIIDNDPAALWDTNGSEKSQLGQYHHWGEPLYGYYNSKDPWVIRKHIELLTYAGIDFIAFDCTNGFEYIDVVAVILPILQEYYDAGWNVPKFMFYLNSRSKSVIHSLYYGNPTGIPSIDISVEGIYKAGKYKDLWFMPNGTQPKIAAITAPGSTNGEGAGTTPADHIVVDPEILSYFDFWESQWPNKTTYANGLPWMDWNKPQKVFTDTINVSVAQHNSLPFSDALLSDALYDEMWGRGYTAEHGANHSENAINAALNFEEAWTVAKEKDLTYTFVTGWNEWVAIKSAANLGNNSAYPECRGNRVYFVDTVNYEFSRDIEMMKGGYTDNVFLSMMRNTREYKSRAATLSAAAKKTIDIAKGLSQWATDNVYYDMTGIANRDHVGFDRKTVYKDDSIINDISQIRVSHDDDNIYFLVECTGDIVKNPEADNWMNLLIDVNGNTDKAWNGYNYAVNKISSYSGECGVERIKYESRALHYELTAKANFSINGRYMQYSVPRTALGIKDKAFTIGFKIADNVADSGDMQSYYITGSVAPVGRLNYTYSGN